MKTWIIIIVFYPCLLFGQNDWTLQACIDSALINNPEMQLAEINLSIANIDVKSGQWNFLPSVNGTASHGYNWGQTIDPFTNSFATDQVRYNNFYLSSSLALFSGLQNYYEKKITGIDLAIILANKEIEKRNLILGILGAFLQTKLNEEIVSLKSKHLSYTKEQVKRAKLLEDLEYDTKHKRLESQAQESNDQYELIQSQNDLKKSLFLLQLLIGIEPNATFSIADSISLKTGLTINETQINRLEAEKNLLQSKQIKGSFSPTISVNGSIGSGYSENNKFLSPDGSFIPKPFGDQINENFYQSLFATLSVPIFNGLGSYSQIAINKQELERIRVENEQRSAQLTNTKLENQLEVGNQKIALKFAEASFKSYKLLFEDSSVQYENGAIDYYQYLQNKDAFFNAESELIQAEYRLKFAELVMSIF
ncbi:MAG: outer membrane protein [Crocinitomix sp.]|jgi:outer membrane protein